MHKALWEWFGRRIRSKEEVPPGMDFCDSCGRLFPKEEMHHVLIPGEGEVIICEECSDKPPSSLRFFYRRWRKKNAEE